ncbi:M48 family metallopeptidase [Lachnospiraceae bacterium ZAX-1]
MNRKCEIRQVMWAGNAIEYQLTRKPVKNINLRVKQDKKVLVSANTRVPVTYIDEFVTAKGQWILNAWGKQKPQKEDEHTAGPKQYLDGERFLILGKLRYLKVLEGTLETVSMQEDTIYLTVQDKGNFNRKEIVMNQWKTELEKSILIEKCKEVYELFRVYNIDFPVIKIKSMSSMWGSCRPKKGIITLNSNLIQTPMESIEYVVLHEFAHFLHPNHAKEFYALVAFYMPDWKERKKGLLRKSESIGYKD